MKNQFHIEYLSHSIIPKIVEAFNLANWPKSSALFENYLQEQCDKERFIWVAMIGESIAVYITLKVHSKYPYFEKQNIPEIMDFNVLPNFRKQGIGSALLAVVESYAFAKYEIIGLGVGLYADYGQALKLYVKYGYKPDGQGITSQYKTMEPGSSICLDDDLSLWFTKKRSSFHQPIVISKENSQHYTWGDQCDGWWLHQTEQFSVIHERMPQYTFEKKHYHNYVDQFFYCLEGLLTLEIDYTKYQLEHYTGISIPARTAHTACNFSNDPVEFLVISVPNVDLDRVNCD